MSKKPVIKRKNPNAIKDILKNIARMDGSKVEVGFIDDEMHKNAGMTVKELAMIHEFGSKSANIPARPFIEPTMRDNRFKYRRMMFVDAKNLSRGRKRPAVALTEIGEMAVEDMKLKILDGRFTPLKPKTVERKGHAQPLIESDQMYDAIKYKVTSK